MSTWAKASLIVVTVAWIYIVTLGTLGIIALRDIPSMRQCFGLDLAVPEIDSSKEYYR